MLFFNDQLSMLKEMENKVSQHNHHCIRMVIPLCGSLYSLSCCCCWWFFL